MSRPKTGEFNTSYQHYIDIATGNSITELINYHTPILNNFINSLPQNKATYAYATGKWTVKQLLQHIIDAERIFAYRALRISRKDNTPLPGFDENTFAENATAAHRNLNDLQKEFTALRLSTNLLLQSFTQEQLAESGMVNNHSITVNAICYIIFGHNIHHKKILEERYLTT